jgi:hypothetical protein
VSGDSSRHVVGSEEVSRVDVDDRATARQVGRGREQRFEVDGDAAQRPIAQALLQ